MIISFSTITFDKIGKNYYLGGPADYGGIVLDFFERTKKIKFLNVCNISKKDIARISPLNHKNLVPNYVRESVNFELIIKNNTRKVLLKSKKFKITEKILEDLALKKDVRGNTVVVSPVISEFTKSFYSKLLSYKPKALFLDLYNNDDGKFSKNEILLFEDISLNKSANIFFKLSQNELQGLTKSKVVFNGQHYFLTTFGANGAELKTDNLILKVNGLKVKTVNSTGSGDVFLYTFASLYDKGIKLKNCLKGANKMAAKSTEYLCLEEFSDELRQ